MDGRDVAVVRCGSYDRELVSGISRSGSVTVDRNTIENCAGFLGMVSGGLENLDIYDNGGSGCGVNGIDLSQYNWNIACRIALKKNRVPYTLVGRPGSGKTWRVPSDSTLTILPGVVIKCLHSRIQIDGTMQCVGTPREKIHLTSAYDETVGGRTINHWGTRFASYHDWSGVRVRNDNVIMSNTRLAFGGGGNEALLYVDGCSPEFSRLTVENGSQAEPAQPGGNGIIFDGVCGTHIRDLDENGQQVSGATTITYCDKAVWVKLPAHRPVAYPSVEGCNLWDSTYGVWVDGYDKDIHDPINAQNNDWCRHGVENGPAPAGDGSGVSDTRGIANFDAIDVLPWKGLVDGQKVDDDDETKPEVCIVYNAPDIAGGRACDNLADVFSGNETAVRQRKGEVGQGDSLPGGERDMRDYFLDDDRKGNPGREGQDPLSFDNVDLAMYAGHGWIVQSGEKVVSRMSFASARNDGRLDSPEIAWGDQDLEWAIVYNCRFFAANSQVTAEGNDRGGPPGVPPTAGDPYDPEDYTNIVDVHDRLHAQTIDKGLHSVMGFGTREWSTGEIGELAARHMLGDREPLTTVRRAWFNAAFRTQPRDKRSEDELWRARSVWDPDNLAVAYGASGYMDDYFWGKGPPPQGDPGPGATPELLWRICNWKDAPSLPESELPCEKMHIGAATMRVRPGQTVEFDVLEGSEASFDSSGPIIVRFRDVEATGERRYVERTAGYGAPGRLSVQIPALPRGRYYDALFLNNNMTFGYLVAPPLRHG